MADTPNLGLPQVAASQAQKHVTVNEALALLDCLAQISVLDRTLTAPPSSPGNGDRYLVPAGATGVWAGKAGMLALYIGNGWVFVSVRLGMLVYVVDEDKLLIRRSGTWGVIDFT